MPIDDDGFLAAEIQSVRERIRTQYRPLIALCYDLNTFGQQTKFALTPHADDGQRVIAAALLAKVMNDCQAAVVLVEFGMPLQAQTMLRSALEALFNLILVCKDASFVDEYTNRDLHDQKRLLA